MSNIKDCIDCKHSFFEDLDSNLCCRLKNNQILRGVLDDDVVVEDDIPAIYDYSYPNTCENYEVEENEEQIMEKKIENLLEDFKIIKTKTINAGYNYGFEVWDDIEQALLKLDFLENSMDLPTNCFSIFKNRNGDEIAIIRTEKYKEYQEQEKENAEYKEILRIIFEKKVDTRFLRDCKTVEKYNKYCDDITDEKSLTQEEFDLVKKYYDKIGGEIQNG